MCPGALGAGAQEDLTDLQIFLNCFCLKLPFLIALTVYSICTAQFVLHSYVSIICTIALFSSSETRPDPWRSVQAHQT